MRFLTAIYNHITNIDIISNLAILLMSISILLMAFVCLYSLFIKKETYNRNIAIAGVIVRILMLIAFCTELYHQIKFYSFMNFYLSKEGALRHFISFLFFSYIVTVGVHYILTIYIKNWKGFFYTFDIVMLSIPLVHGLVVVVIATFIEKTIDPLSLSLICSLVAIYSFFQMYWKQNKKWYIISIALNVMGVGLSKMFDRDFRVMLPVSTFLLLLTIYELCRIAVNRYNKLKSSTKYVLSIICIILIFFANPFFNVWTLAVNKTNNNDITIYRKNTKFTTLDEAKAIAKKAVGDNSKEIKFVTGEDEDFYNRYLINIGEYKVTVDETSKKLSYIHRNFKEDWKGKIIEEKTKNIGLSQKDILDKSMNYLKKMGFTYNPKLLDIKIKKEDDEFYVEFFHKYQDGTFVETDSGFSSIVWRDDGQLDSFNEGVFNLQDYREVTIDYDDIEKIVDKWYKKINKKTPEYAVVGVATWYLWPRLELDIKCKDGYKLVVDGNSGDVIKYSKDRNLEKTTIEYSKGRKKAFEYAEKLSSFWEKGKFVEINREDCIDFKSYNFQLKYNNTIVNLNLSLDNEGNLLDFSEMVLPDKDSFQNKNINISKKEALNKVLKRYKIFSVYTQRIKPSTLIDKDGKGELKWMVVVLPYASREHHVYFVDINTGDVKPLDDYKVGVKNE